MRLTVYLCRGKRVHRDILQSLRNRLWRTRGSVMQVDRLRVPDRLLRETTASAVVAREAEDMFTTTRYTDALAAELEPGLSSAEARRLEEQRKRHMTQWSCHAVDPRYAVEGEEREACLFFSAERRFSKGLDQACVLTNTVISLQTAPQCLSSVHDQLLNRFQALDVPGRNEASSEAVRWANWSHRFADKVDLAILHAHVWHTDETKLPRRFRPDLPIWRHKTEHGIHPTQATRLLTQNLFRLIETETPQLQQLIDPRLPVNVGTDNLPTRWTTRDRLLETFYQWGADADKLSGERVGFAESNDLVVCGREPLGPFLAGEPADLRRTLWDDQQVRPLRLAMASLGPMSPLIDLIARRNYLPYSCDGWTTSLKSRVFPHPHVITVNASLPNTWSDFLEPEAEPYRAEDRQAIGLMHCFASALAHTQVLGHSAENSPGLDRQLPICLQAVCSDGVHFDLIAFQLNSISVPNPGGGGGGGGTSPAAVLPNLAWIDGNHRLFNKQIPKRSMLRNTKYQDLDMSVLLRLASFYLWALLPSSGGSGDTGSAFTEESL